MNTVQFDKDGNIQVISWDRAFEPVVQKMNGVVSQIDGVTERLDNVRYFKPKCDDPNGKQTPLRCGKHQVGYFRWPGRTCQEFVNKSSANVGLCAEDIDGKLRHYYNADTLGDIP